MLFLTFSSYFSWSWFPWLCFGRSRLCVISIVMFSFCSDLFYFVFNSPSEFKVSNSPLVSLLTSVFVDCSVIVTYFSCLMYNFSISSLISDQITWDSVVFSCKVDFLFPDFSLSANRSCGSFDFMCKSLVIPGIKSVLLQHQSLLWLLVYAFAILTVQLLVRSLV